MYFEHLILGWLAFLSVAFIIWSLWLRKAAKPLVFTTEEMDRYAPHSSLSEFRKGFLDYQTGTAFPRDSAFWDTDTGIAYDRGIDCAIARGMNWRLNWPEHVNRT